MGKLLGLYHDCKNKDDTKYYLFKSGLFYYFLEEDARYFSDKYGFKLTGFGDSVKCGFPIKSLEKYLFLFQDHKIEVVKELDFSGLVNKIKSLNLKSNKYGDSLELTETIEIEQGKPEECDQYFYS